MSQFIQIQWTCGALEEARAIAEALVERGDVACANVFPHVESIFKWRGRLEKAQEVKVFLKTTDEKFPRVVEYIQTHASYEVPEISKGILEQGNPAFLAWVIESTS
jgi:periplasmic divalent cation tolerance protein